MLKRTAGTSLNPIYIKDDEGISEDTAIIVSGDEDDKFEDPAQFLLTTKLPFPLAKRPCNSKTPGPYSQDIQNCHSIATYHFDGFGLQMLKRHGWNEGQGLGVNGGGLREPLSLAVRPSGLGLGAATVAPGIPYSVLVPSRKRKAEFVSAQAPQRSKLRGPLCPEFIRSGNCSNSDGCKFSHSDQPTARPSTTALPMGLDRAYHNPAHFPSLPYDDPPEMATPMVQPQHAPTSTRDPVMPYGDPETVEAMYRRAAIKQERRRKAELKKKKKASEKVSQDAENGLPIHVTKASTTLKHLKHNLGSVNKDISATHREQAPPPPPSFTVDNTPPSEPAPVLMTPAPSTPPATGNAILNHTNTLDTSLISTETNAPSPGVPQHLEAKDQASSTSMPSTPSPTPSGVAQSSTSGTPVSSHSDGLRSLEARLAELKALMHKLESSKSPEEKKSLMTMVKEKNKALTEARSVTLVHPRRLVNSTSAPQSPFSFHASSSSTVMTSGISFSEQASALTVRPTRPFMRLPAFSLFIIEISDDEGEDDD